MILYHATDTKGFYGIVQDKSIKTGHDKIVYLTDSPNNAIKFLALRVPVTEDIYVFQVDVPQSEVHETFDHSYRFFQCKSYGYPKNIDSDHITGCARYPAPGGI